MGLNHLDVIKCSFEKNIVKGAITNIQNSILENMNETSCFMNNNDHANNLAYEYQLLGGCFKSSNVQFRVYAYLIIDMGYSESTAIGMTIIDDASWNFNVKFICLLFSFKILSSHAKLFHVYSLTTFLILSLKKKLKQLSSYLLILMPKFLL